MDKKMDIFFNLTIVENVLLEKFQPKLKLLIEFEDFIVKTALTSDDLKQALQLRHKVFLEEWLDSNHKTGLDFDDYDQHADHLMIIEKSSKKTVGVYRLIHSKFSDSFYSENEFFLDHFLKQEGNKLELGRACTHINFRTGRTMDLLWKGLSQYIRETKTQFLFGCSSISAENQKLIFSIFNFLKEKGIIESNMNIQPKEKYRFKDFEKTLKNESIDTDTRVLRNLPPLLRSYLHAGSRIHGLPAFDKNFDCFDLFTILDLKQLNKKFKERYNVFH